MTQQISPETLALLQQKTLHNTLADANVLGNMYENDERAGLLSPGRQAEYRRLRQFFESLKYHESEARYFSYHDANRRSWFFCPRASEDGQMSIELSIYATRADLALIHRLEDQGICVVQHGSGFGSSFIRSSKQLLDGLEILCHYHAGFILPGATEWIDAERNREQAAVRDKCHPVHPALQSLALPDFWL